jgi:hypothetical protein
MNSEFAGADRTNDAMRTHLIVLFLLAIPAAAAPPAPREVAAATTALSRSLHDALRRNGTLPSAKAAYDASPVDGGEVMAFQWMLADCLRVQRAAFRTLLADADRLPAFAAGFERRRLVMDLLDRMVEFRKANRRLASLSQSALPAAELPPLMKNLERQLAEMDSRVADLKPLVEAAL